MPKKKVGSGETTSSLAKKHGFFWQTIWDHPENAELKAKRKDPNVLFADDDIFIPEKKTKQVSKGTEQEHVFKLKGTPAKFKMALFKNGEPRANEPYVLDIDGTTTNGTTDGDGKLEHFIPPDASSGRIIMKGGRLIFPLKLGSLDPIDLLSGVQQRLNNLGYACTIGDNTGEMSDDTRSALKDFQGDQKLEQTGELDAGTKAKLQEMAPK